MSKAITQQMGAVQIAILVILSVLWGGSFFFVGVLVEYLPPLTIVTLRVAVAALVLWLLVFILRQPIPKNPKQWASLFIIGFLNNALPFGLIVWGQTQISSGLASILNATTPFFTVIVASIFLADEKANKSKILGVVVGIIGTIVLIGPETLSVSSSALGQLAVIGAALSYALAAAYARRFKSWGLPPLMIATGQVSAATILLLPLTLFIDKPWLLPAPPPMIIAALFGLALLSTVLAYILYFRLIAEAGATNAALVTFLIPISAILLGVFILGEVFTGLHAVGMALIGLGLIIMDGRLFARLFQKQS